jgi:hypothetical protein
MIGFKFTDTEFDIKERKLERLEKSGPIEAY